MPYIFSQAEQAEIQAARAQIPGDNNPANLSSTGNWAPLYQKLSEILGRHISAGDVFGTDLQNFKNAKLWLDVATGANAGVGMHSAFIRTYTNRQGELRIGRPFSPAEMQLASNGVALNLYRDLIGANVRPNYAPWSVPAIDQIADADASSIGRNLFAGSLPATDDAVVFNAGWSGALGFNLLGGRPPYESWRLLVDGSRPGDPADPKAHTINSLDDYKNLLFAVDAYSVALKAGYAQGGADFVTYLASGLVAAQTGSFPENVQAIPGAILAQVNVQLSSGNILGHIKDVAAFSPAISSTVNLIADIKPPKFLDMLMGAVQGKYVIGTTTETNFATNAKAFFSSLTPAELEGIDAKMMPTSASSIVTAAKNDVSVRAALMAGSIIRVQVGNTVANAPEMAMYNDTTGSGSVTEQWLADRAYFVLATALGKPDSSGQLLRSSALPVDTLFEFRYKDVNGQEQVLLAENTARSGGVTQNVPTRLVYFGSEQNDRIEGSDYKLGDRLYGGNGNDTLEGLSGADDLEGGAGADTLDGGVGADTLRGGLGDDTLVGSAGDDTLEGGSGNDTYIVDSGDGVDIIRDTSGNDQIRLRGQLITSANVVKQGDRWIDKTRNLVFTKTEQTGAGTTLTIEERIVASGTGSTATIPGAVTLRIENFTDGRFGITLPGYVVDNTTPTNNAGNAGITVFGDRAPLDVDPTTPGLQTGVDSYGNLLVSSDTSPGRDDVLYDSVGNDTIEAGDGLNAINADSGGADRIIGGNSIDIITNKNDGANDGDLIRAGGQADWVWGGGGNDIIEGGAGRLYYADEGPSQNGRRRQDSLHGEDGNDIIYGELIESEQNAFLRNQTEGRDATAPSFGGGEFIAGGNGDDKIFSGGAESGGMDDYLIGGQGNDQIIGGGGHDSISGDANANAERSIFQWSRLRSRGSSDGVTENFSENLIGFIATDAVDPRTTGGADQLYGGTGEDWIFAGGGDDTADGGKDDDVIFGDAGSDSLNGGDGNDVLHGDNAAIADNFHGNDSLYGGDGKDTLYGGAGNDLLDGGNDDDQLLGGKGEDRLLGGTGNDRISGGLGNDTVYGGGGNDLIEGDQRQQDGSGDDRLFGEDGNDLLMGQLGDDVLDGGAANDILIGGAGNDTLLGDTGTDRLIGGGGDDFLDGGTGIGNVLDGGAGNNTIVSRGTNDIIIATKGQSTIQTEGGGTTSVDVGNTSSTILVGQGRRSDLKAFQVIGDKAALGLRNEAGDQIVVKGALIGAGRSAQFVFADGEQLTAEQIVRNANEDLDIDASDTPSAAVVGGGAVLFGGRGNDVIRGSKSADIIDGGSGNNILKGGAGNDTYRIADASSTEIDDSAGNSNIDLTPTPTESGGPTTPAPDLSSLSATAEGRSLRVALGETSTLLLRDAFIRADRAWLTAGNQSISQRSLADQITADLTIDGTDGADTIRGARGNDLLQGGAGQDAYLVGKTSGADTINDSSLGNRLVFDENVGFGRARTELDARSGRFSVNVVDDFGSPLSRIDIGQGIGESFTGFEFRSVNFTATASTFLQLSYQPFSATRGLSMAGSTGNDLLTGGLADDILIGNSGNDRLDGGAGNDTIVGGSGSDIISGGGGSDLLLGGQGDDTYLIEAANEVGENDQIYDGDGVSTFVFGAGVARRDIRADVMADGRSLRFSIRGQSAYTLEQGLAADSSVYRLADGSVLTQAELFLTAFTDSAAVRNTVFGNKQYGSAANDFIQVTGVGMEVYSGDGDDFIGGSAEADVIDGGAGNNTLSGGRGIDTYMLTRDTGTSVIFEFPNRHNLIRLERGLALEMVKVHQEGEDLRVALGDSTGGLILRNQATYNQLWEVVEDRGDDSRIANVTDLMASGDEADVEVLRQGFLADARAQLESESVITEAGGNLRRRVERLETMLTSSNAAEIIATSQMAVSSVTTNQVVSSETRALLASVAVDETVSVQETQAPTTRTQRFAGVDETLDYLKAAPAESEYEIVNRLDGSVDLVETTAATTVTREQFVNYRYELREREQQFVQTERVDSTTRTIERLVAGAADNRIVLGGAQRLVDAGAGNDVIVAKQEADGSFSGGGFLYGNAGDDDISGADGNDMLIGGQGSDRLDGGGGADRYYLRASDVGWDTVIDRGTTAGSDLVPKDLLVVSTTIDPSTLAYSSGTVTADGVTRDSLDISWAADRGVRVALANENDGRGFGVEALQFYDGSTRNITDIVNQVYYGSRPELVTPIGDQRLVGENFAFAIPVGTFRDTDTRDRLSFTASTPEGALPEWLQFDAATGTFSGVIRDDRSRRVEVTVTAADRLGQTASDTFTLVASRNENIAPIARDDTIGLAAGTYTYLAANPSSTGPANLRDTILANDTDENAADVLRVSAVDTTTTAGMLSFDAASQIMQYAAYGASFEALREGESLEDQFGYTAEDGGGLSSSATVRIRVLGVEDAPEVISQIGEQTAYVGANFSAKIPAGAFRDRDQGDTLVYSVTQADGSALPSWLQFDAQSNILYGEANATHVGELALRVTATDSTGRLASQEFSLAVLENALPVANPDYVSLRAGETRNDLAGALLENDYDLDGGPLRLVSATAEQSYGSLSFDRTNQILSFTADGAAARSLAEGESAGIVVDYAVEDDRGAVARIGATIEVIGVNDAPELVQNAEAQRAEFGKLFAYDATLFRDVDVGDTLHFSATLADGAPLPSWLYFDPTTGGFNGIASETDEGVLDIVVTATDQYGASASSSFALTIGPVIDNNVAPVANADTVDLQAGSQVTYALQDLVANDTDADGDALVVTALSTGNQILGSASLDTVNGTFTYDAGTAAARALRAGESAVDQLSYSVSDGRGGLAYSTIDVTVRGQEDAPITQTDVLFVNAGNSRENLVADLLSNDTDPDRGDSLRVVEISPANALGRVELDPVTQTARYVADTDALRALGQGSSTTDFFSYTVQDTTGNTAMGTLVAVVQGVNDAPEARNDVLSATVGLTSADIAAALLANDLDVDNGDTKSITSVDTTGTRGNVAFDAQSQSVQYTANASDATFRALGAGQQGADSFSYTVTDNFGATSTATVNVNVIGVNDAPDAQNDAITLTAIEAALGSNPSVDLTAQLLANDIEYDNGDLKTITSHDVSATTGSVALDSNTGAVRYQANSARAAALGAGQTETDRFGYTVTDHFGASSTASVDVTIVGVNDAPVLDGAIADQQSLEDAPFVFAIDRALFRDVDNGDSLSFTAATGAGGALPAWLQFDATALVFTGRPENDHVGALDLRVTATDQAGAAVTAGFRVDVINTNDGPVARTDRVDLSAVTTYGATDNLAAQLLANDTDVDVGDTRQIVAVDSSMTGGKVVFDLASQTLTYDTNTAAVKSLAAGETGTDVFRYTIADQAGAQSEAAVLVVLTGVNDAPEAQADTIELTQDQYTNNIAEYVLSNDVEYDRGDTKTLVSVSNTGSKGTVAFDAATQSLTYDARTDFLRGLRSGQSNVDTLTYTVKDAAGLESTATIAVTVTGKDDAPILVKDIQDQSATADTRFTWQLPTDMFKDVDTGDTLSIRATLADGSALPSWLIFNAQTGELSGLPGAAQVGAVTIKLTATDSTGLTAADTFVLNVAANPNTGQTINGTTGNDTLRGGTGNDTIDGGRGNDTISGNGGNDRLFGGIGNDWLFGNDGNDQLYGGDGNDSLDGGVGDDLLDGDTGNDLLSGGAGNDQLLGGAGSDTLRGGADQDYLNGGDGTDVLLGEGGNDLLLGGNANDILFDTSGNNFAGGGAGNDLMIVGSGNNVVIGGTGNDTISLTNGNDLMSFNRGDGSDSIWSGQGGLDTLSLGGGIRFEDLRFGRASNDLVLLTGGGESLSFRNWYGSSGARSFVNLQMIQEASGTYNPASGDATVNNKVENFSFTTLVRRFDEARASNPRIGTWSLMNARLEAHLGGSDTAALGGDFAYRYGTSGNLSAMGIDAAQALLANASLTTTQQNLQSAASLGVGAQRLG